MSSRSGLKEPSSEYEEVMRLSSRVEYGPRSALKRDPRSCLCVRFMGVTRSQSIRCIPDGGFACSCHVWSVDYA